MKRTRRLKGAVGPLLSVIVPLAQAAAPPPAASPIQQIDPKAEAIAEGREALTIPAWDRAEEAFRRAARIDPDDPVPRIWLGRTRFERRRGDLEKALAEFEEALRLDPTNAQARYWKARTLQRLGGKRYLRQAKQIYEGLIAENPLYEDALRRLLETHVGLGTLEEYVIEREEEALRATDDPVATFRYADALRQYGELGRAESLLRGLRENHRDFAPGRVNYALALTLYDQERWDEGTEYYLDAITFMEDPVTARAMWEDAYLIADLDELQRFRKAETVQDYRNFLRGFWKKRDITKTTVENERIGIHYKRLAVCWRTYRLAGIRRTWNDPDAEGRLRKPPTYDVDAPFNDMGLVYLRHGEPDDRAFLHLDGQPENMSWKYEAKGNRPEMIVHFEQDPLGGGWRLVAAPRPGEMALSRTSLDPKFGALLRGADPQIMNRIIEDSNADLREALTRDTHIPEFEESPLTLFTDAAAFKGAGGLTRYEVYWAIPLADLMSLEAVREQAVNISASISVFTRDYSREVYRNSRTQRLPIAPGTPQNAMIVDQETMALPPGDYVVALEVRESYGRKLQIQEMYPTVRGYRDGELAISDIQIAQSIVEGERGGRFVKPGYTVMPLPTRVYSKEEDAKIFFGIYGLAKDEFRATRYRVSYQLMPASAERGTLGQVIIGGLLGRREAGSVIVTGDEESGIFSDVNKVLTIDVGGSSFRTYRLRVTVEDLVSGRRAERVTFFRQSREP